MTQFIKLFTLSLFFLASCTQKKEIVSHQKKPNILFIFTDDQTYSSINALGNKEIITPNLDKLVAKGTTFTHAYNMGSWSGAVCAASRAMMISGRSVWHANQFRQHWKKGDSISKTWGKLMQSAGYNTYLTGKWHVDAPASKVFQKVVHERPGMPKDTWNHSKMLAKFDSISKIPNAKSATIMPIGYNRPLSKNDTTWTPTNTSFGGFWEGGKHWSEVLSDDATTFLDIASKKEQPFFMYLAFNAPHDPRQAPKKYQDMYSLDNISLPKSWLPEYPDRHQIANGDNLRDEALAPFPRTEYASKIHIKEYYASITHLDAQIGKILEALKATGKDKNTYIIFTADHGLAMGRHGLLGKQNLYDHSIRPPLIIAGPDIPINKKVNADVYLQDVMATSLELAGIQKPEYVFFNSFKKIAQGNQQQSNYKSIYGAYLSVQRMIRKNGFKLLVYPKAKKIKLFDLNNDPEEMNNLSLNIDYTPKISSLFKDLKELQLQMNDTLDIHQLNYYQ